MLTKSRNNSRANPSTDEASLQLIVDDLLCGRAPSSVDKKIHPLLVSYLQKAKNNAIQRKKKSLELKINRIISQLTLSSPITPRTKKTPKLFTSLNSQMISKAPPSMKDYSEYNEEIDRIVSGETKFEDIEISYYYVVRRNLAQRRDEAAKQKDYKRAKVFHDVYVKFHDYLRKKAFEEMKNDKKYTVKDDEYIETLKRKYSEAVKKKEHLVKQIEKEDEKNKNIDIKNLTMAKTVFNLQLDEIKEERKEILDCKDFKPSRHVIYLRDNEERYSKAHMYEEAELEMKKAIELEKIERETFIKMRLHDLRGKKHEIEEQKKKQLEILDDKSKYKHEKLHRKQIKLMAEINDEIKSFAHKIEEIGEEVPDEFEIMYYTAKSYRSGRTSRTSRSRSTRSRLSVRTGVFDASYNDTGSVQSIPTVASIDPNIKISVSMVSLKSQASNSQNSSENASISMSKEASVHSSNMPHVGTPSARSISNLQLKAVNKNTNVGNDDKSSKNDEYEFVFEEESDHAPKPIIITPKNSDDEDEINNTPPLDAHQKKKENEEEEDVTEEEDDDASSKQSVFLSDSLNDSDEDEEIVKKTRHSLSYKRFLTPEKVVERTPRQKLCYEKFLYTPKQPSESSDGTETILTDDKDSYYTPSVIIFSSSDGYPNDDTESFIVEEEEEEEHQYEDDK
ncbi:hypothetical protein TRFO_24127 [Tritrichomonas foetus]|uniref:Uncharacterized protein n=1 Tax=Tritrichomonas foetus TaxID=1144522 RepID=A0A1J4K9P4_9EUKA|nr:hypothetical protein TRFO_24127 [Tritrichomonas foetus]|eukprot:OHT07632.1 hypothetical protein TRFO_24127 [Tritrichomonas foetus]